MIGDAHPRGSSPYTWLPVIVEQTQAKLTKIKSGLRETAYEKWCFNLISRGDNNCL